MSRLKHDLSYVFDTGLSRLKFELFSSFTTLYHRLLRKTNLLNQSEQVKVHNDLAIADQPYHVACIHSCDTSYRPCECHVDIVLVDLVTCSLFTGMAMIYNNNMYFSCFIDY